ncbi:MAG TPA: hypothetical protein VGI40_23165 [Pirellulaceae bacterium]|jgi:hypothetical protein
MKRWAITFAAALISVAGITASADDTKKNSDNSGKNCFHAKITAIDQSKDTLTVKTCDKSGKEQQKTLQLSKDVAFRDISGNSAKKGDLKVGDDVVVHEKDGKVTEIKENDEATITKVDSKAGTVTLKMKDKNGKETEKTFTLVEDAEYIDSNGRVAALNLFRNGDQVLVIEGEGKITSIKKSDNQSGEGATANKPKSSSTK